MLQVVKHVYSTCAILTIPYHGNNHRKSSTITIRMFWEYYQRFLLCSIPKLRDAFVTSVRKCRVYLRLILRMLVVWGFMSLSIGNVKFWMERTREMKWNSNQTSYHYGKTPRRLSLQRLMQYNFANFYIFCRCEWASDAEVKFRSIEVTCNNLYLPKMNNTWAILLPCQLY